MLKDALLRDDPALVIDCHNAIIRARSSIGTHCTASRGEPRDGGPWNFSTCFSCFTRVS